MRATESEGILNPCPKCGQPRLTLEAQCQECSWAPAATRSPPLAQLKINAKMLFQSLRTISISSLFLLTTLVAVCVAVCVANPVLGGQISLTALIALPRSALHALYAKINGLPLRLGEMLASFLGAFFLVLGLEFVCTIFFLTACFSGTMIVRDIRIGLGLGILCYVVAMGYLLYQIPVYSKSS